jgi:hypothetical protein
MYTHITRSTMVLLKHTCVKRWGHAYNALFGRYAAEGFSVRSKLAFNAEILLERRGTSPHRPCPRCLTKSRDRFAGSVKPLNRTLKSVLRLGIHVLYNY